MCVLAEKNYKKVGIVVKTKKQNKCHRKHRESIIFGESLNWQDQPWRQGRGRGGGGRLWPGEGEGGASGQPLKLKLFRKT